MLSGREASPLTPPGTLEREHNVSSPSQRDAQARALRSTGSRRSCVQAARLARRCVYGLTRDSEESGLQSGSPDMSKLQIEERRVDDVTVVVLTGEMLLDDGDLAFRRHIATLLDDSRVKILVDLDGVSYIDSSGVGMM